MRKLLCTSLSAMLMMLNGPNILFSAETKSVMGVVVSDNIVSIDTSGSPKYNTFGLNNPERLVIDFPETEYKAPSSFEPVSSPFIKVVRGSQFKKRPVKIARIVIELASKAEFEVSETETNVSIKLFSEGNEVIAEPVSQEESIAPIVIPETSMVPSEMISSEPVYQAPEPVPAVEPLSSPVPEEPYVQTPIEPADTFAPTAPETSPKPAVIRRGAKKRSLSSKEGVSNQKVVLPTSEITLNFENADIRDVLRVFAIKSGINIIYGPDVTGTVTIRLDKVPFDKALLTLLSLKSLVYEDSGPNIIRIVTPAQISSDREKAVTFTKVFPLNYARAQEIKLNLDAIRTSEGRKGGITVDDRTNSLIVTDTPEGLIAVENVITELDKKPEQVIIEAKIVEINLNSGVDVGIAWKYAATAGDPNSTWGASQVQAAGGIVPGPNATVATTKIIAAGSAEASGTGVSFPATPVTGQVASIAFGVVSNGNQLNAVLSMLAQKGLSKILSSPKVTTINNKEAKILIGQKIPYTTVTVSQTGSTQATSFLDVGIKLTVTPTINADRKITLKVNPVVSLFVRTDPAGPVIGTREAETTVLVSNGETVVIGGLITDEDKKLGIKVPLLGDIPIIGYLFKRQQNTKDRTELLVFITPQIVS